MQKSIFSSEQSELLALLKQARHEAGLTQADVTLLLDLPQAVLSNIERGERRIDLLELRRLLWALGLTLPEFVSRLEERLEKTEGSLAARQEMRKVLLHEVQQIKSEGDAARVRLEAIRRTWPDKVEQERSHGRGKNVQGEKPSL